jgi:trehalose synthase-fused probable maltokinase
MPAVARAAGCIVTVRLTGGWESLGQHAAQKLLEPLLLPWLQRQRWFGGKARTQCGVTIADSIPIPTGTGTTILMLARVGYPDGDAETYALPVAFGTGAEAARLEAGSPALILARTDGASDELRGVLYDAAGGADFARVLLEGIVSHRCFRGGESSIECSATSALKDIGIHADTALAPRLSTADHSNSAIRFGDRLLLKLFRRAESGINPDLEIGRALLARRFENAPPLTGFIEYHAENGEHRTLGVLHRFVAGAIDGWEYTLGALGRYFDRVRSFGDFNAFGEPAPARLDGTTHQPGRAIESLFGADLEFVRLLGRRTAGMHLALACLREDPAFTPEPFTSEIQRGLSRSLRDLALQNLLLLKGKLPTLGGESRELAAEVIAAESRILDRFQSLAGAPLTGLRIRVHGDYHLGQTLYTGGDVFIVDFEGEPTLPLRDRRRKCTPFRDVAGLLRSFDYAANAALRRELEHGAISAAHLPRFTAWANRWARWISAACLESYLSHIAASDILPAGIRERALLLETHLLRRAVYELGYEANNRPDWLPIPCRGILALLSDNAAGSMA